MSEPIYMSIEIGGVLKRKHIKDFLYTIDEISELMDGPTTEEELTKEINGKTSIIWRGCSNYGECDEIKAFCVKHKLSYIHHCQATAEYDAAIKWWTPNMEEEHYCASTQNAESMVSINQIKPYIDMLVALVKSNGNLSILPTFVGDDRVTDLVEIGLKTPDRFLPKLQKKLAGMLLTEPELPPFTIKETSK